MSPNPKPARIVDKKYRASFKDERCIACRRADGTVVGAHIRAGNEGGLGMKPADNLILPLCHRCHADQEAHPGAEWWEHVFAVPLDSVKELARHRYRKWKGKK